LEKYFSIWKTEFTSNKFLIVQVMSQRHFLVGAPSSCLSGRSLIPCLRIITWRDNSEHYDVTIIHKSKQNVF
jgi:hypothetical protein